MRFLFKVVFYVVVFTVLFGASPSHAESVRAEFMGRRLLAAAQTGDPQLVARLLKAGAKTDFRDITPGDEGETALHKAAYSGNVQVVRVLLKAGAAVDARDERGETPLLQACFGEQFHAARVLLAKGAAPAAISAQGLFPLQTAAFKGNLKTARLLLSSGAKINQKDKLGRTALMTASRKHIRMVKLLLAEGADVKATTRTGTTALMVSAAAGRPDIARVLIAAGARTNARRHNGKDAGYYAIVQFYMPKPTQSRELLELLWEKGARPRENALWMRPAIRRNRVWAVRFLLSKGFSARNPDLYSTGGPRAHGSGAAMRTLLRKHGARFPSFMLRRALSRLDHGEVARILNAGRGDAIEALNILLYPGAFLVSPKRAAERARLVKNLLAGLKREGKVLSAAHRDQIWYYSLSTSYFPRKLPFQLELSPPGRLSNVCGLKKNPELLRDLIKRGFKVNARHTRTSLLASAVYCGSPELTRILLEAGARKDVKNWRGFPLTSSAHDARVLRLLLDAGVKLHPSALCHLMAASHYWKRNMPAARLLLAKGASPDCRTAGGVKLLLMAVRAEYEPLIKILKAAGAREADLALDAPMREDAKAAARLLKTGKAYVDRGVIEIALKKKRHELYALLADHFQDTNATLPLALVDSAYGSNSRGEEIRFEAREFMRMLVARGVNLNAVHGYYRWTPLLRAVSAGDTSMMQILLRGGARVNARNYAGETALFMCRKPAETRILLKAGAHVNIRDARGDTPLHAALYRDPRVIRLLVQYGADIRARGSDGRTVIERARANKKWAALRAMGIRTPRPARFPRGRKYHDVRKVLEEKKKVIAPLRKKPPVQNPRNPANPTPIEP